MKILSLFACIALCTITLFSFSACGNDGDSARDAAVENVGAPAPGDAAAAPSSATPATPEPPQNAAGVWHYTCPKGCDGGGGSAIACAKCGSTLEHNQGYHANQNTGMPEAPAGNNALTPVPKPESEPAQNSTGTWHYTCPKGCAGGGGSATACPKCGATLAHNPSYHK